MGSCFSQRRESGAAATYHASPRRSLDSILPKRLSLSKNSAPQLFAESQSEVAPLVHSSSVKKSASSRRFRSDQDSTLVQNVSSVPSKQQVTRGNRIPVAAGFAVSGGNPPSLAEIAPENRMRIPSHATANMSRTSSNQVAPDVLHSERDTSSSGASRGFVLDPDKEDGSANSATTNRKLFEVPHLPSTESSTQSLKDEAVKCLGNHNDTPDGSPTVGATTSTKPSFERRSRSEGSVGLGKLEVAAAPCEESQVVQQEIGTLKKLKPFNSLEYFSHVHRQLGNESCQAMAAEYETSGPSENSAAVAARLNMEGIVKSLSLSSTQNYPSKVSRCFNTRRSSEECYVDLERIIGRADEGEPAQIQSLEEQDSIDGGAFNPFGSDEMSAIDGRLEAAGREREGPPVELQRDRKHEENRLSSDLFELNNGYLSLSVENEPSEQKTRSLLSLKRNRNEVEDGETFAFKKEIWELSKEGMATEEFSRLPEISLVSTGDAVLFSGSNSDEFHLIPSGSYFRENASSKPKSFPTHPPSPEDDNVSSPAPVAGTPHNGPATREHSSFCIDDIILLLENEEVDEEQLLNLLISAKASRPASDVASESSFEFKVKSAGSTPHSTPSTPMLSAGSTPRRIAQLSPIALTPEEIAEIWGVFEQRHMYAA